MQSFWAAGAQNGELVQLTNHISGHDFRTAKELKKTNFEVKEFVTDKINHVSTEWKAKQFLYHMGKYGYV